MSFLQSFKIFDNSMVEPFPDQNIRYCSAKSSLLNRYFEIYAIKKAGTLCTGFFLADMA
jgi:hypothetical protein